MILYLRGGDLLAFRHRHCLEEYFEDSLEFYLSPSYDFFGGTDSTSAMIMTYLFLYSERFDSTAAFSVAQKRLCQLERMLADRGKPVLYLERVKMGNLTLDPSLSRGEYRFLTEEEVELLRQNS